MRFPFPETLPIAHRGAHGGSRAANSMEALQYAIDLGAPAVELDFVGLADGVLVVSHDRILHVGGKAVDLTRSHVPDVEGVVPFAEDYLDAIARAEGVFFNLDWKGSGETAPLSRALREHGLIERTVVSCTSPEVVSALKRSHPWVTAGLSVSDPIDGPEALVAGLDSCEADAAMLNKLVANQETVASLRSLGYGVFVWTASDAATYAHIASLAPDGIATDMIELQMAVAQ